MKSPSRKNANQKNKAEKEYLYVGHYVDENGNYIYGFCEGNDGQDLYDNVQASVDAARADGADYVVAVAHLGIEETSAPWR